ncbi:histone deacetylase complex subunit SAP130-like isoform X1 [Clytia hemisphaerica]|uniref:histone deacetylase complex subunit SAP130-like isoform X1 n=1 Tax=Clytia hemisphaerica TaxID=252671 RepID=UPI0034D5F43B
MSRIHEERKDFYNKREGVLTTSPSIRNIATLSQNMDKEKSEKTIFGQQNFVGEAGFRTVDLIKQPGRNIVPASLSATGAQLHAMPHLVTNYMTVPLSQARGQHTFQAHIPVGIRAATAIAPSRASIATQRLQTLKPTNITNQIQLPLAPLSSIPILPPSVAANNRTGSPTVTTHGMTSESRHGSRTHDSHSALRGNIQATSQTATIQVVASGNQVHLPTSLLTTKSSSFNTAVPNMLKIGVSSHTNAASVTPLPASGFKLAGIGKAYPGASSVIIPSAKPEEHRVSSFSRFPSPHSVTIPAHQIQGLPVTTTIANSQSLTVTTSTEARSHSSISVPYQQLPTAAAYVFHDIGSPLGLHNFSHQLVRPQNTSSTATALPLFTVDSSHAISTVPVSVPVTKGHLLATTEASENSRVESLTIHANNSLNYQNLYPNLLTSNISTTFTVVPTTSTEPSSRPSILRKRHAETTTPFPVQPTEKERISSPLKVDRPSVPTRLMSPPQLTSEKPDVMKPINHSIQSITADVKSPPPPSVTSIPTATTAPIAMIEQQQQKLPPVLTSANTVTMPSKIAISIPPLVNAVPNINNINSMNSSIPEASPKKKPRKQHIITTEDKYGSAPINSACATDEDEEFLKSNETMTSMKDITPPKLIPASTSSSSGPSNPSIAKQLYAASPILNTHLKPMETKKEVKLDSKLEFNDRSQINGLITAAESKAEPMKYVFFRRRSQFGIMNDCKVNSKAAHNHFYRYSDVRVKDEKKSLTQERLLTKSSMESASGWRLHHLSSQFDDLVKVENGLCEEIIKCKEMIPTPNLNSPTSSYQNNENVSEDDLQLRLIHELIQGSIQRCRCSTEQLEEAKSTMFKLLDHKPKAMETLKKYSRPKLKSKKKSS